MSNLPHSLEAEQALLGMILEDNARYDEVSGIIKSSDFSTVAHSQIYTAISIEIESGRNCDPLTLSEKFKDNENLKSVGGASYLKELTQAYGFVGVKDYANQISIASTKRTFIHAMNDMMSIINDSTNDVAAKDLICSLEGVLFSALKDTGSGLTLSQALHNAFDWINLAREGRQVVYKTGLTELDRIIGGLRPDGLYIIGARPGMGKTVLGLNLAEKISHHKAVKFFSLEMPSNELCMRLLAGRTGLSVQNQMEGKIDNNQNNLLIQANMKLSSLNFEIDDKAGVDVNYIISESRRFARKNEGCAIFIDYLGLIRGDMSIKNKVHQIEEITTRLKALAKEIKAPVVLLSQLSRSLEAREDKRPLMSDLRDSGSIEQDADVIMFIYREEFYLEREEPVRCKKDTSSKYQEKLNNHFEMLEDQKGKAQIIVAKNRQGTSGTALLGFDGQRQKFYNL